VDQPAVEPVPEHADRERASENGGAVSEPGVPAGAPAPSADELAQEADRTVDRSGDARDQESQIEPEHEHDAEKGAGSDDGPGGTAEEQAETDETLKIDLSSLPANESPRQLAERIYIAHQVAGVRLEKADLARWAGYKNPGSGRTEYKRLEEMHGPIVMKEGAGHIDLDWSSVEQRESATSPSRAA
jgi:hypothetical protein